MIDLVLGSLQLGDIGGGDAPYTISALADDATWGNPAPIEVAVRTLLQNSSSVVTERYDNREAFIRVRIEAPDGAALAEGEEALFAELGRRNVLTYTPSDGFGPPTVFYVITSSMDHALNDLEQLRNWSSYSIRLVCEAFARSVDEVVVEAEFQPVDGDDVPLTPVDDLVDACSSTSGWSTVSFGLSVVASGGTIHTDPKSAYPTMKRTGSIDMSGAPLLVLDLKLPAGSSVPWVQFESFSAHIAPTGIGASPTTGYARYWYPSAGGTLSSFTVGVDNIPGTGRLYVAEVRKQSDPPAASTLRQKFFTAAVGGSAPSEGTLEVYHATDGLGQVLLYTWPTSGQGFTPALRELKSASGSTSPDSGLVSGASNDLAAGNVVYDIPGAQVPPGTYEVGAWLQSDSATVRPVTVTAETVIGSTVVGSTEFTKSVDFDATGTWYYVPLGRVELPVNHLPADTEAIVRVTLSSTDSSGIDVDEAYLFNLDSGALTVVDCGDSTRLWVNSATLDWPMPSIMVGDAEDGSDSYSTGDTVTAWGVHEIKPRSINVFAVTPDALDAGVRVRHTRAWHTHAGS